VKEASEYLGGSVEDAFTPTFFGVLFIAALIATTVAICLVYKISENEGRNVFFSRILKSEKQGYKLVTVPLLLALSITFGYMVLSLKL
jgi:hypothetical protein